MIRMTRKELQNKLMELFMKLWEIEDQMIGINDGIFMNNDQIKMFNKKLAFNKADTQLIMNQSVEEVSKEIDYFKREFLELESIVNKASIHNS